MELGQTLPLLLAGQPRHRERRGNAQGHAAGRDGTEDVCRRHTRAGTPAGFLPPHSSQNLQAATGQPPLSKPSQLLRGLLLSRFPCLITNNVFLPSLNYATDIRGSATIWPHFLVWDPVTVPEG